MLGEIRGEVRFKEPLSFHTSLAHRRAGGHLHRPAGRRRHPAGAAVRRARAAAGGRGREAATTCSCSDRGIRGVVLKLEGCLGRAEFHGEEAVAGAGVSLSALIREAAALNLGGHRVPGRHSRHGRRRAGHERGHARRRHRRLRLRRLLPPPRRHPRRVQAGRRRFTLPLVHARRRARCSSARGCSCTGGRCAEIQKDIKQRLKQKKSTQPLALASAGCVWKNPPSDLAAPADREGRAQGQAAQRRGDLRQARQLHRQPRRRHGAPTSWPSWSMTRERVHEPLRHQARARDQDPRGVSHEPLDLSPRGAGRAPSRISGESAALGRPASASTACRRRRPARADPLVPACCRPPRRLAAAAARRSSAPALGS